MGILKAILSLVLGPIALVAREKVPCESLLELTAR